jgi:hypothetical protein
VAAGQSILIDLRGITVEGQYTPLMAYGAMEVYLNGRRLTERLDYVASPVTDDVGNIVENLLAISCQSYLDLTGGPNVVDVIVHGDAAISSDAGFVVDNTLYRANEPKYWSRSCGRAYVDGKLTDAVTERASSLVSSVPIPDGRPYWIETCAAYGAVKLMGDLSPNDDLTFVRHISEVLGDVPPTYPDQIVLDQQHHVFSPFLAQIACDLGTGQFVIKDDPSVSAFFAQFSAYFPLADRDPTIGADGSRIDRRFVAVSSSYTNSAVIDAQQMILFQRLVDLVSQPSVLTILEALR